MTGKRACFALLLAVLSTATCAPVTQPKEDAGFRVRHTPPGNRDVFEALLASGGVGLTDASCIGAGRDKSDATVGAYLSGFLTEMNQPSGGNHIVIEQVSSSAEAWVFRAMLRHSEGEDIWSWGVEFAIRKRDGSVDPRSFRCIGAG
jgi:hypothetical protein